MSTPSGLDHLWVQSDQQFFHRHRDRYSHIRKPWKMGGITECEQEFRSLGDHAVDRRHILLWRIPEDHPMFTRFPNHIQKIPFIAFMDETIEDRDDVLLPIIDGIMKDAAKKQGIETNA